MAEFPVTGRTRLKRLPQRAVYDRDEVYAILDEGFLCHVGFVAEGQPFVIPTGYARRDNELLIHGSAASRMLRNLAEGIDVCVTVTLVDALVLAKSAFHHSMNYRSVMMLGTATLVTGAAEKMDALRRFTDHIVPGRWDEVRQPTESELKQTSVLKLPLETVSAKVRKGPEVDDEDDLGLGVWAGVVPLRTTAGPSQPEGFDVARLKRFRK